MKIVSINPHYQDGLGYQDYYLGKEWVKNGHDVHFIASDRHFKFPEYDTTVKHIIGERYIGTGVFKSEYGATIHRLKGYLEFTGRIWMQGLESKIEELSPDIIICHGIFNLYSYRVAKIAAKLKIKVVFDEHTTTNLISDNIAAQSLRYLFKKFAVKNIEKVATKIVGISDSVMIFLTDFLGFKKKLAMISLGADTETFYPDAELGQKFREKLEIKRNHILIVYTGKIYDKKRPDLIVDALNAIDSDQKIVILFVGDVALSYKNEFGEILKRSKWGTIHLPAILPDELLKVYNAADIAAWPAHLTGSTVDASACGCPVIVNNLMGERITHQNGIGINDENLKELIVAFKFLIENPEERKKMGYMGAQYVNEQLSWGAISKRFLE